MLLRGICLNFGVGNGEVGLGRAGLEVFWKSNSSRKAVSAQSGIAVGGGYVRDFDIVR